MQRARPHLGTIVAVRAEGARDPVAAIAAAFDAVARVERLMGCHDPATELSQLNRGAHREAMPVHPWTFAVFRLALTLYRQSGGAFDCAVGGRHVAAGRLPAHGAELPVPGGSSADIDLSLPGRIRFRNKLHVDLGGIAKGFAVDRAIDALRRKGARSGTVNAGGDLRSFGDIREPVHLRLPSGADMVAIGDIWNAAVATSVADPHPPLGLPILDVASGNHPELRVVSVVATQCAIADALTKVVALRGARSAHVLARHRAVALCCGRDLQRWSRLGGRKA